MSEAHQEHRSVVGVTTRHGADAWIAKNTLNYLRALDAHSAFGVVLSPDAPALLPDGSRYSPDETGALPADILESLDGIVLSGGGDVHPRYFGQEIDGAEVDRIDPRRDALELSLTRAALERNIPIFGICRGCQVLNVAAGGALVQHFGGHRSPEDRTAFHQVNVRPNTRLRVVTDAVQLRVNTFHHQGIDDVSLAPGFVFSGIAEPDTWLVEAIEIPDDRWVMGVQWHPERTFELDESHGRLWRSFVSACSGNGNHSK